MPRPLVHPPRLLLCAASLAVLAACTVREETPEGDTGMAGTAGVAGDTAGGTLAGEMPSRVLTIAGFQTPESVLHDRGQDVYFVSNIVGNPSQKDNDGFISRVRPDGTVDSLRFIVGGRGGATLHAPKGMTISGDTLWVADIDAVRAFNRTTGAPITSVELSAQNPQFLNDVAVGPDGAIYVTDTGIRFAPDGSMTAPGPQRVFRIGPQGRAVSVAVEGDALGRPNGIAWDGANDRFIIGSFGGNTILTWAPGDQAPATLATGPGQFDGIAVLDDGRILASSWADSSVHVFLDGALRRAISRVNAPADIGWDAQRNRVLIPLFSDNRVEVWEIGER